MGHMLRRLTIQLEDFFGWGSDVRKTTRALLEETKKTNDKLKEINETLKVIAEREPDPLAALFEEKVTKDENDTN